jgi:hypothetical protein
MYSPTPTMMLTSARKAGNSSKKSTDLL